MKRMLLLSLLLLAGPVGGCDHLVDPTPIGTFRYASYDTTGTLMVQGLFTMDLADSDSVAGEWHFAAVGNAQNIGPQTGDGMLIGRFRDTTLWIELQPQYRDNNLELAGVLRGDRFAGEWVWISFAGVSNKGPFEAVRQ